MYVFAILNPAEEILRERLVIFGSDDSDVYRNGSTSSGHDPRFMKEFPMHYIAESYIVQCPIANFVGFHVAYDEGGRMTVALERVTQTDNDRDSNNVIVI